MSTVLLIVLTVVEIVALVAVLALFVIALTRRLRSVATALEQLSGIDLGAIQGDVCLVGAGAAILNNQLDTIAAALPAIAEKAESLPSQRAQIPQQSRTEASGAVWQPAIAAQDPQIRQR